MLLTRGPYAAGPLPKPCINTVCDRGRGALGAATRTFTSELYQDQPTGVGPHMSLISMEISGGFVVTAGSVASPPI